MVAVVFHAGLDLSNSLIDQADRSDAVAALVRFGDIELMARGAKIVERIVHVRLIGDGDSDSGAKSERRHDSTCNQSLAIEYHLVDRF